MIEVGSVEGGPELDGTWVSVCASALVDRLPLGDYPNSGLSLVYLVPGSVTSPGFEGVRLGRLQKGPPAWLQATIGVPASVVESDRLPDVLLGMAEDALGAAAKRFGRSGIPFDPGHFEHFARLRQALAEEPVQRPPSPRPPTELQRLLAQVNTESAEFRSRGAAKPTGSPAKRTVRAPLRQNVTLHLILSSEEGEQEELGRLFAFEDDLERTISGIIGAELEGNEIGSGEFTLFIRCQSANRTWASIEPVVRGFGPPPGSYAEFGSPRRSHQIVLD